MRRLLSVLALAVALALASGLPVAAKEKVKIKPGGSFTVSCPAGQEAQGGTVEWFDKTGASLGTAVGVASGSTITFGPAPRKVEFAIAELDCLRIVYIEGTAPVTDQGLIIFGADFVGLPIPGGDPSTVQGCPTGTTLDFARSTFTHPANLEVQYLETFGVIIVLADFDTTGTIAYRIACVGA
jgi:hypothetical protein